MHRISPNYSSKKIEPPFYKDLVDVFEDRTRYWMLKPAKRLLETRNGQIAAIGILINYFEGIEIYLSGKDSKRQSKIFFTRGFKKVFPVLKHISHSEEAIEQAAHTLYEQARCGFSHDGIFRNRVLFSDLNKNAIVYTFPKKNGKLIFNRGVESIVINPFRFYDGIDYHFEEYLKQLKKSNNSDIALAFKSAVSLKWGLETEYISIGISMEKFVNNPKYKEKK